MIREIKTFEIECNYCHKKVVMQQRYERLPEGWGQIEVRNCGLNDYTRYDDACPECLRKHEINNRR